MTALATSAPELRAWVAPESSRSLLLTAEQCAALVQCHVKVWRRWCRDDPRMPQPVQFPHPESRDVRWYKKEVLAYIENLMTRPRQTDT